MRYLIAGGWNTAFGYFATVVLYYLLSMRLHIVAIGILANIICISMSFLTYKLFVFKSQGEWIREYFRSYVVYGGSAVIGISGLWFLVDMIGIPFWLAQAVLMVAGVIVSYVGHDKFTFNKRQRQNES